MNPKPAMQTVRQGSTVSKMSTELQAMRQMGRWGAPMVVAALVSGWMLSMLRVNEMQSCTELLAEPGMVWETPTEMVRGRAPRCYTRIGQARLTVHQWGG